MMMMLMLAVLSLPLLLLPCEPFVCIDVATETVVCQLIILYVTVIAVVEATEMKLCGN